MADSGNLLDSLTESSVEQEKLCEEIRRALELSEDPGKLVLDAVRNFHGESVGDARKRSCVVLLEQLARLRPGVAPAVKAEAASLARRWRVEIREKGRNGVLEVMGFCLLLGAYDLFDEFDGGEFSSVLRSFGSRGRQAGAEESGQVIASTRFASQENSSDRSLEAQLELVNQIASSFLSHFDALQCFCVDMNGNNLKLFLCEYLGTHDWSTELRDALKQAPDPAKLVLDAMPGFLTPQSGSHKILSRSKVRKSCILLLEQLMAVSPEISPSVRKEALTLASERGSNIGQMYQSPVFAYGFLLYLAVYGIFANYKEDELLGLLEIANQYKAFPKLCRLLGLDDKVEVLIRALIEKSMFLDAVDYVYAYDLMGKFPPVRLLKDHLNLSKQRIDEKADKSSIQQTADKEIAVIKTIIKYISKFRLESEYPLKELQKQMSEVVKKKKLKVNQIANVAVTSDSCAGVKADVEQSLNKDLKLDNQAQVKVKPSLKEDPKLDDQSELRCEPSQNEGPKLENQARAKVEPSSKEEMKSENQVEKACNEDSSPLTSRWPRLESLCASIYGNGLSFFSRKQTEVDSLGDLNSFCFKMDGKSLRMFLYDHVDGPYPDRNAVCDALKYAPDPAKLVLDVMRGFLHSHLEFDESLSLDKVRRSQILLLEQLIIVSPHVGFLVKEEALTMANEWRENLGINHRVPSVVYGFLLFIAAYELVSNYDVEELLGLLLAANYHKATSSLARILGLENKVFGDKTHKQLQEA